MVHGRVGHHGCHVVRPVDREQARGLEHVIIQLHMQAGSRALETILNLNTVHHGHVQVYNT